MATVLNASQKAFIDDMQLSNRHQRRAMGKQLKAKIPALNKPYVKEK